MERATLDAESAPRFAGLGVGVGGSGRVVGEGGYDAGDVVL